MSGAGLGRGERLKGRDAIQRVMAGGRSVQNHVLVIRHLVSEEGAGRRFAIGVSREIRGAVRRNLLRRRLREIWRTRRERLPEDGDFLIIARSDASSSSFLELSRSFDRLSDALVN